MEKLVIVGAGDFGREVYWLIQEVNEVKPTWDVLGFLDDNPRALDGFSAYPPILGPPEDYSELGHPYAACTIGNPQIRKRVVEQMASSQVRWATILHPTVRFGTNSTIGEGCIFCTRSLLTVDVHVGNHVHVNCTAGVGHDVYVGDFCTLSSHVDICGHAVLEEGVFLGSHAVVLPKTHVGAWATIGAGSVVLGRVAAGSTYLGVPARMIRVPTKEPSRSLAGEQSADRLHGDG
jgi:sugar O-acyltransferase (sialic acid O-acetyltransferase NeuD family)